MIATPIIELLTAAGLEPLLQGSDSRDVRMSNQPDAGFVSVEYDSRLVRSGSIFCCLPGSQADGHQFAPQAVSNGASTVVAEHPLDADSLGVPVVIVNDARRAMGFLAAAMHSNPASRLRLIGITGTNGKTTTTSLIASILRSAGIPTGEIGTLTGTFTTPESPELQAQLSHFVDDGIQDVVMEVSSHALSLQRVAGCSFDISVFTNLGHDHLDFHGDVESYFLAKQQLFLAGVSRCAVVNVDDPYGLRLTEESQIPIVAVRRSMATDVVVTGRHHSYRWSGHEVFVPIGGAFNVMNSLTAAVTCLQLGVGIEQIVHGLSSATPVAGRFQSIDAGQSFDVIVDFAHTPDGLREALAAARRVAAGQLTVVFGCGGDRDREKRPEMGAVAAAIADRVVITSDNPRNESPADIANAIREGVSADYRGSVVIELDRRRAIANALSMAGPNDVVMIAGKGHETTQTVGGEVLPFDDRQVAKELLELL